MSASYYIIWDVTKYPDPDVWFPWAMIRLFFQSSKIIRLFFADYSSKAHFIPIYFVLYKSEDGTFDYQDDCNFSDCPLVVMWRLYW